MLNYKNGDYVEIHSTNSELDECNAIVCGVANEFSDMAIYILRLEHKPKSLAYDYECIVLTEHCFKPIE